MSLESKIQEILIASLPEQTAGMMKQFIQESNKIKETCNDQQEEIELLKESKAKLQKELKELEINYNTLVKQRDSLNEKEIKLEEIRRTLEADSIKLELTQLKSELKYSERAKEDYARFLSILVKNPVSEEYFMESKYNPGGYKNNSDGTTTYLNSGNSTEERRQKIEKKKED